MGNISLVEVRSGSFPDVGFERNVCEGGFCVNWMLTVCEAGVPLKSWDKVTVLILSFTCATMAPLGIPDNAGGVTPMPDHDPTLRR